jgi:hypothetical protein
MHSMKLVTVLIPTCFADTALHAGRNWWLRGGLCQNQLQQLRLQSHAQTVAPPTRLSNKCGHLSPTWRSRSTVVGMTHKRGQPLPAAWKVSPATHCIIPVCGAIIARAGAASGPFVPRSIRQIRAGCRRLPPGAGIHVAGIEICSIACH